MNTVEALREAFPQKFPKPKDKDDQAVANRILAGQIVESLLWAVHFSYPIEKIKRLNLELSMELDRIQRDGNLEKVIEEIKRLCQFGIEQHADNSYHLLYRLPKEKEVSARKLLALQIIPAGAKSNSYHRHLDQQRAENIFLLSGKYRVNFHNSVHPDVIVSSRILNPFEGIVIDPRRYHSVANIGKEESKALILGTQLVDSATFSR